MKTFKPQGAELVEEARMEEPDRKPDGFNAIQLKDHYIRLWREYNAHIKSLLRYTINPSDWKGITQVKEGEFEVRHQVWYNGAWNNTKRQIYNCYTPSQRRLFAIPKREEETQVALWHEIIDLIVAYKAGTLKDFAGAVLNKYTLTKKEK